MQVYLIPGLATDKRLWKNLVLPASYNLVYLDYFEPEDETESFANYAKRMLAKVNTNEPYSLIGMSLGGILASEMNKFHQAQKLVLISTLLTEDEKPAHLNFLNGKPYIWRPAVANVKSFEELLPLGLGIITKEYTDLLMEMFKATSNSFLLWAIKNVLAWDNKTVPENYLRIHGFKDKLFPPSNIGNHLSIRNGSHAMILDKGAEISKYIHNYLKDSD